MNRAEGSPQQTRAQDRAFVQQCSLRQLKSAVAVELADPSGAACIAEEKLSLGVSLPVGRRCAGPQGRCRPGWNWVTSTWLCAW